MDTSENTNMRMIINTEEALLRPRLDRASVIQDDVIIWSIIDGFLFITILGGNLLTILAVRYSRRLRTQISNLFVLSLAISDIVVGLTVPYHLAFYTGSGLGAIKAYCLLRFFFIIFACCISIWNLIAIAIDRFLAICYPLHYSRLMTKRVAIMLLSSGWGLGLFLAIIPVFWNKWKTACECEFDQVLYPWYMVGMITPTFSLVWLCLLFVYWRIWREAARHVQQMRTAGGNEVLSDWKSVQVVLLILGSFSICWLPYFVIACAQIFEFFEGSSPIIYKAAFSLAMANSGMNPIIYAWKNVNFRNAFTLLLRCKSPNQIDCPVGNLTNLTKKSQPTLGNAQERSSTTPVLSPKITKRLDDKDSNARKTIHVINEMEASNTTISTILSDSDKDVYKTKF